MFKTVSLFSGIGGLDFGFEEAGFDTSVALELDAHACRAMKINRPSWKIIEEDINKVSSADILRAGELKKGSVDMLIGGPPCQPFSKSGYWSRGDALRLDDPRADTLTGYLRVLRDIKPRAFLLENVSGLAYQNKDEGLRYILDGIAQINSETGANYSVTWKLLNTAEYGVPQIRERVFIIGSRDGRTFEFPEPTHTPASNSNGDLFGKLAAYSTTWDAIGGMPEPPQDESGLKVGGKWGELLPTIPEGQNYLWHTDRGGGSPLFGWRTRYWCFLLKLAKNLPSWTIQAQPGTAIGPFHWNNRRLTFKELCRIQTFPDDLSYDGSRTEMQRMLGNAVPSLIAEVLAREIRKQFFDAPMRGKLKLLPQKKSVIPPAEVTLQLPAQYRSLIGNHKPHPGTGKGRMAQAKNSVSFIAAHKPRLRAKKKK